MQHPAFPQGGMEFPHNFDPQGMMMPPVPPALGWYGTPMLNRPMGIGAGGNGVNPFWTPGTQARANQGMENQPSGARRVLEGSFNQVGEGMNSGMHRQENGDTERQNGLENENGNPPVGDPLSWFRGQVNSGQKDLAGVVTDPVELFRIRCLREAEQKFTRGMEQMMNDQRMRRQDDGVGSFRTAPSENPNELRDKSEQGVGFPQGPPGLPQMQMNQPPKGNGSLGSQGDGQAPKPQGNLTGNSAHLGEVSGVWGLAGRGGSHDG